MYGEEALGEAKRTGKPILLSVGYSACHWCHVMAHESFEDPAIAKVMNELFVNIKVDREERPDIDQIYQVAQAMLTQRNGGWPLTMFLTPDQLPFFGGTYFPDSPRYGMPGFGDLIQRVRHFYDENPEDIRAQGEQLAEALTRSAPRASAHPSEFSPEALDAAAEYLKAAFDREHGGFSGAPKFPHPDTLELLLRRYGVTGDERSARARDVHAAQDGRGRHLRPGRRRLRALQRRRRVGDPALREDALRQRLAAAPLCRCVGDHARAALRACVRRDRGVGDARDAIPAGRLLLVARRRFRRRGGKFYVWTPDEVRRLLTDEEYAVASAVFGLDGPPNFENKHWHLVLARPFEEVARV